jgi:hypothetical protein
MGSTRVIAAVVLISAAQWAPWTLCFGQTRPAPPHQREAPPKPATQQSGKPAPSDARLETIIRAKFAKSKIDADKFQVHVQGGVATIEGRTDVTQHKGVATRLAKTGGALAVNNHIQVSDAAKEKAAANLEKGRRRTQIKRGDARSDASQPPSR